MFCTSARYAFALKVCTVGALLLATSLATVPASAACMPVSGGPCINVQPYTPRGMGGVGGFNSSVAILFGQVLGTLLSEAMTNEQAGSTTHQKSVEANAVGLKNATEGHRLYRTKEYARASQSYARAISYYRLSLKLEPNDKIVLGNLAVSRDQLLFCGMYLAYNAKDWTKLVDVYKEHLRYHPNDQDSVRAIAEFGKLAAEQQANAQGSAGPPVVAPEQMPTQAPTAGATPAQPTNEAAKAAPVSIGGKWAWQAKCEDGTEWKGEFTFEPAADGTFNGSSSGEDGGTSISGKIAANRVTFTRQYLFHSTVWTATLAGNRMHGSETSQSHGKCTFHAIRV